MTSTLRKAALAAALASGVAIGGVGVTQAFAQTASPSASSTANGGGSSSSSKAGNTDSCPHDSSGRSSSTGSTST